MSLEESLRESISARVQAVTPPPVPMQTLVSRGRRRQAIRRSAVACGGVLAVAAVAVAVSGGPTLWPNSSQHVTEPAAPIVENGAAGPVGIPGPTEVFTTDESVSIDGKSFELGNFPTGSGPHVGMEGIAYPAADSGVPYLLRSSGERTQLAPDQPAFGTTYEPWVAADSATPMVAWAESAESSVELVAFDTNKGTEIDRRRLSCTENNSGTFCPRPYAAVHGVVFVMDGGRTMAWRPADDLWVSLGQGNVSEARGFTVSLFAGVGDLDLSPLGPEWSVLEVSGPYWKEIEKHGDIEALLSFDGEWITDANGLRVEAWRDPSKALILGPPGRVTESQFDTDGSVLYVTEDSESGKFRVWDCPADAKCVSLTKPSASAPRLMAWDT